MALSDYLEKKFLDHVTNNAAFTQPTTLFLALFSTDPTDAGSGTEISTGVDTAYARQQIHFAAATSGAGTAVSNGTTSANGVAVSFGAASSSYTVYHIGIFDASSAGNLLFYGPLTAAIGRIAGKTLVFDVGAVTLAMA